MHLYVCNYMAIHMCVCMYFMTMCSALMIALVIPFYYLLSIELSFIKTSRRCFDLSVGES